MNLKIKKTAMVAVVSGLVLLALPALGSPVSVVIKLKEKVSLRLLADDVKNPNSPRFQKFYSPEEIQELSGPSQKDYDQVITQLKSQGFEILKESPTRLWISARGDSSLFRNIQNSNEMSLFSMSVREPVLNIPLVESVSGLDQPRKSRPRLVRRAGISPTPGGIPAATIKSAYGFNPIYSANINGAGQDIAIATYNGFNVDDVNFFYNYLKISPKLDQVTFNGTPTYDEDSSVETQLDAEFSGMMAPGANVHVFASSTNDDPGELQLFTAILDDNRSKVVNYSWGDCEANVSASHQSDMDAVFARAVAQGVNIMVASGDSGSDSCQNNTIAADWPGANPDVVAVGGTTFSGNANKVSESAWSDSGGGISKLFDLPTWQSLLGSPYVKRSYPDVAFNADPNSGQAVYAHVNGQAGWLVIGGTSMAAPQWTGFMTLVGHARQMANKAPLGYLNPAIYGLSGDQRTGVFNDVTSGSNGAYSAGPGWDAVTGFGSMKADSLLQTLVGI